MLFMQSDGGLTPTNRFIGSHAILSGPAGGVVGYAMTTMEEEEEEKGGGRRPVIGFDMGGTSTDVSRFAGEYEHVFESTTAGVTIQAPQVCGRGGVNPTSKRRYLYQQQTNLTTANKNVDIIKSCE